VIVSLRFTIVTHLYRAAPIYTDSCATTIRQLLVTEWSVTFFLIRAPRLRLCARGSLVLSCLADTLLSPGTLTHSPNPLLAIHSPSHGSILPEHNLLIGCTSMRGESYGVCSCSRPWWLRALRMSQPQLISFFRTYRSIAIFFSRSRFILRYSGFLKLCRF